MLANLPSERQVTMEDFYYAGGLPALLASASPQLDLSCLTITKNAWGECCGR